MERSSMIVKDVRERRCCGEERSKAQKEEYEL
jgi:hypothetical protein